MNENVIISYFHLFQFCVDISQFRLYKKVIFALFPLWYWIVLLVATLFMMMGGILLPISYLGFNLLLILIGLRLALLIHEVGHLLFAKVSGGIPRLIIFGYGPVVSSMSFRGLRIILNSNVTYGITIASFNNLALIRLKLFIYLSGGFILNFLIAGFIYFIFGFSVKFFNEIQLASSIILGNVFLGTVSLIPYQIQQTGIRMDSDGLSILKVPFRSNSVLSRLTLAADFFDALDLFELKRYTESIPLFEDVISKIGSVSLVNFLLSVALIKTGRFWKAITQLKQILPSIDEKPFDKYKHIIYNNLAWSYLLIEDINNADVYSELAIRSDQKTDFVLSTRGAVLIMKGDYEEGINLLEDGFDFSSRDTKTVNSAIFLYLSYDKLGNQNKAERYIQYVDQNLDKLDHDDMIIYNRIKKMTSD